MRALFLAALRAQAPDAVREWAEVRTEQQACAWAERYQVNVPWVGQAVFENARLWQSGGSQGIVVSQPPAGIIHEHDIPLEAWDPTVETEAAFRIRVEDHIRAVAEWAVKCGLSYRGERRHLQRDLDAFISYQVSGWDMDAVIDEYYSDFSNDAARKALTQISVDLGIPLRKQ